MGEARHEEKSAKAIAFGKSSCCIFCGGTAKADTVEHYPPKSIFSETKWPEGYVFPACKACNHGTRNQDLWIAFISRLEPADPIDVAESERTTSLFKALRSKYPDQISQMFDMSSAQARDLSKRLGLKRAPGELYRDLPLVHLPVMVHEAVRVFATKLTKALHFHHTGRVVPDKFGFKYRWFSNADHLEGKIPAEVFTVPNGIPTLTRTKIDLSDQFTYRYTVSENGELGMYTVMVRFAFCFTSLLSFDPGVIEAAEEIVDPP